MERGPQSSWRLRGQPEGMRAHDIVTSLPRVMGQRVMPLQETVFVEGAGENLAGERGRPHCAPPLPVLPCSSAVSKPQAPVFRGKPSLAGAARIIPSDRCSFWVGRGALGIHIYASCPAAQPSGTHGHSRQLIGRKMERPRPGTIRSTREREGFPQTPASAHGLQLGGPCGGLAFRRGHDG